MHTILIVDDEEPNRALLRAYLASQSGLTIVEASTGQEALVVADRTRPDLVLLDVLMPGIDGFETTRRLKQLSTDAFLPVVLVTALTDQGSRREGLLAGADDFLSKPVDPQELSVRIRNLLALRDNQRALREKNHQLADLHRFKKELSALLVHDLKSPLTTSIACLEFCLSACECGGEVHAALGDAHAANRKLVAMLANLLEVESLEAARLSPSVSAVALEPWLSGMLATRRWEAAQRNVTVECRAPVSVVVGCDPILVGRVLDNLLDNALRYTPPHGRVVIETRTVSPSRLQIRVGNTGDPIPLESRVKIFEKYGREHEHERGPRSGMHYGFGLYFCKLATEAHGGHIWVEETPELPTMFVIELAVDSDASLKSGRTTMPPRARGSRSSWTEDRRGAVPT